MYKANKRHLQPLLISNVNELPEKKRKCLEDSWAKDFYREFFSRIHEDAFAVLYVDHPSRKVAIADCKISPGLPPGQADFASKSGDFGLYS